MPGVNPTMSPCFRLLVLPRKRLSDEDKVDVSPHVPRYMFLHKLAEITGIHNAREASSH